MNGRVVKFSNGVDVKIEVLLTFKVEELGKEYVAYLLNDDGKSDKALVYISSYIVGTDGKYILSDINEEEAKIVMNIYKDIRNKVDN